VNTSKFNDTICALATPSGVGAIATIRVSGTDAFKVCQQFIQKDSSLWNSHTAHFGVFKFQGELIDEVVYTVFKGPHSFTGEDTVEISCHGSRYVQEKILQLLVQHGARQATPGEFTQRAFLNGKMDLAQAEAVADVIASSSALAHQIAFKQMRGGFSDKLKALREDLLQFVALIELELDFSEEDVEFADRTKLIALVNNLMNEVDKLCRSFEMGNVIKNGVPVVIAGKPNVGKSTLLNTLLNEERAIVSPIAGTTRDTIEETLTVENISFRFIDTAGLRETTDEIESIGVKRAMEKLKTAAIIMYLFDIQESSSRDLEEIKKQLDNEIGNNQAKLIFVGNKLDKEDALQLNKEYEKVDAELIFISAKENLNIPALLKKLVAAVPIDFSTNEQIIVSNIRHFEALTKAQSYLEIVKSGLTENIPGDLLAQDIRQVLYHLGEISGNISNEDVLGAIFSKFCIGK
jgi:tRNA modification GTPase